MTPRDRKDCIADLFASAGKPGRSDQDGERMDDALCAAQEVRGPDGKQSLRRCDAKDTKDTRADTSAQAGISVFNGHVSALLDQSI